MDGGELEQLVVPECFVNASNFVFAALNFTEEMLAT